MNINIDLGISKCKIEIVNFKITFAISNLHFNFYNNQIMLTIVTFLSQRK
jgi:hypothetical protein